MGIGPENGAVGTGGPQGPTASCAAAPSGPAGWARDAALAAVGATVFGALVASAVQSAWPGLPATARFWLGMLPLHGLGFGVVLLTAWRRLGRGAGAAALELSPDALPPRALLRRGAGILAGLYPAAVALTALTAAAMLALRLPVHGSPLGGLLRESEGGWPLWLSMLLGTLVLAPLAEEVLFRLVLFDAIQAQIPRRAAVLTALVFAGAHQSPEATPALFLLGMVLQRARRSSGALWLPVTVHAGFNATSLAIFAVFAPLG